MRRVNRCLSVVGRVAVGLAVATVGLAVGSCGGTGPNDAPAVESDSHLPAGYALRLDRPNRDAAEFVTTLDNGVLQIRTGPAGIIYRPDQVSDPLSDPPRFTARARFTEIDAPVGHREGFGLFVGGQELEGDRQRYIYFLVRGDGRYLIKRRDGESTVEISDGWEASDSIRVPTPDNADVANDLEIAVDGERVRFSCNGQLVADRPVGDLSPQGVVGARVNHNLKVRVERLQVERL